MIILSGVKPSFNVLRHQAVELIDQISPSRKASLCQSNSSKSNASNFAARVGEAMTLLC